MSKLPSVITLTLVAALLAGCSTAPDDEPDAPTAASGSASPSATPTEDETTTPAPEETASEEPVESSPKPSPEPSVEPAPEAPEEPAPDLEPLPAGPNDPFVPPPHGEPAPFPSVQHTVTPHPEWNTVGISVQPGSVIMVTGSGYSPGQSILVHFGPANSDHSMIGEQYAYTDAAGNFTFPITLSPHISTGEYGVMTAVTGGPDFDSTRRWASIIVSLDVTSAPPGPHTNT